MNAIDRPKGPAQVRGWHRWAARVALPIAAIMTVAATCALVGCDGSLMETTDGTVEDGNAELLAGEAEAALALYEHAGTYLPETPGLNYVRGLALAGTGAFDEGTQRLLRSLDTVDPTFTQRVRAALGDAYSRWALTMEAMARANAEGEAVDADGSGNPSDEAMAPSLEKWELAVGHLEEALRADPTDAGSLRNLEVALMRVNPPCAARDDDFEPNNSPERATLIEVSAEEAEPTQSQPPGAAPEPSAELANDKLTWKRAAYTCPEDPDVYALPLNPGDRVDLGITATGESELAIAVVGPDGVALTPIAATTEDAHGFAWTAPNAENGVWRITVRNTNDEEGDYDVDVVVRPACESTEDRFEPNDTVIQAAVLTPGPLEGLKTCPDNDDWYAVDLAEGESLFAFVSLQKDDAEEDDAEEGDAVDDSAPPLPPPLLTEVQDVNGTVVSTGAPAGEARVTTLLTPGAGRYFLRVRGEDDLEARYQLMLQVVPPCPEGDDEWEDNDVLEDAVDLADVAEQQAQGGQPGQPAPQQQGPPTLMARVCPGDVDWFKYSLGPDDRPAVATILFEHAKGDLAMTAEVVGDNPGDYEAQAVDASTPDTNAEAVMLLPPAKPETEAPASPDDEEAPSGPPVTWAMSIRGADATAENFYILRLDQPQGNGEGDGDSDESEDSEEQQDPQEDQDKDSEDDEDDEDDKPQDPPPEPDKPEPLQDALDKLDRNPENLEAEESARKSPLGRYRPKKDW